MDKGVPFCSNIALRKKEIDHLKKVFHEKNDYPKWIINQVLNEVEEKHKTSVNNVSEESQVSLVTVLKRYLLVLPYQGQKGNFIIKSMKKRLKTLLPDNVETDVAFQGNQLSSCFNIKDKTKFPHKHDLVYHAKCAEESCNDDYVGETARRISERVLDHSGRDKNSHILKHQIGKEHPCPQYENIKIISSGFRNNTKKRKLSEALWISTLRPSLNKQEKQDKSIPLKL